MKCSELYRILLREGWYAVSQKGSHIKMRHKKRAGTIILPNHWSKEIGKGIENKILKQAGLKNEN